ncbi:MAG TPA: energy transducer TonB, partial [Acidobacteriaceae bacterium]|nr:energy transducer TonB [Acidobacteriaceae bacterium]
WNRIVELNTLTANDQVPFYLKIEFQIYDIKGKPGETGTAEVWWSQHRRYEVIASPSWNETFAPGEHDQPQTRESYLIHALIEQILHPMQSAKISPASKIVEADRKFGSTTLRCLSVDLAIPTSSPTSYCVDPANDQLRAYFDTGAFIVRNKMGKFRDTYAALDITTSYGENKAITGKIVTLKSIPADDEHIKSLSESVPTPDSKPHSGVQPAKKLGGGPPEYPLSARMNHTKGTIVIHATISKEGNVASPIVIASPDTALSEAAINAVRTWKYQSALLNGQPTEIDTVIEINFNLGP